MASITIRNLDPAIKEALRVSAACKGHSMEEEARLCLATVGKPSSPSSGIPDVGNIAAGPSSLAVPDISGKTVILIIGGSIAAYKALDLIRRLRERGARVRVVMSAAAQTFITPLAAGALAGEEVFTELFSRAEEHDIGHIRLAREADIVVVAPCTADRLAKMAAGLGSDLAGAVLLATRAPVLVAPAMNPAMWAHAATRHNSRLLAERGIHFIGPEQGDMAERNEAGEGRMSEPLTIVAAVATLLGQQAAKTGTVLQQSVGQSNAPHEPGLLQGKHIVVTSGPTREELDPVRYIANRSSGRQGHAIAAALAHLGARVTLVSGPVALADPAGVDVIHVESACEMRDAVVAALPADAAVFVAAVADWRAKTIAPHKIKKQTGQNSVVLDMVENPDILTEVGHSPQRPHLVVGFAAETTEVLENGRKKLAKKGADWIVANDVSTKEDGSSVMGGESNQVHIITRDGVETWPEMNKTAVAERLSARIAAHLQSL